MSRRVSLPAADDLFRRTGEDSGIRAVPDEHADRHDPGYDQGYDQGYDRGYDRHEPAPVEEVAAPGRRPSGRVRHDEKMTVYVTSAELLELEHTRLMLRAQHGLAVDRGRLVREAIALVLADFEAHGDESALVRRLTEE